MTKKRVIDDEFSKKIIEIAKEKFGSQKKMADELGLSKSVITEWIKGRANPSLTILKELCLKADISLDYLVLGKSFDNEVISPNLFNEVFIHATNLAHKENLAVNGTYYLGVYDLVAEKIKEGSKESVEKIIDNLRSTILKLRSIN